MRRWKTWLALIVLAIPLLACVADDEEDSEDDPLGELVGTFEIEGRLVENECGSTALPAMDPLTFRVELRHDEGVAIWRRPSAPITYGTIHEGQWRIEASTVVPVFDPNPETGHPGCALTQIARFALDEMHAEDPDAGTDGGLDGGADGGIQASIEAFDGESTIQLVPYPGTDCTPALALLGGPFLTLPCTVTYDVEATPTDPPY